MQAVYTYRMRANGAIYSDICDSLWHALNRAEFDIEQNAPSVEPLSISVKQCVFGLAHILAMLDVVDGAEMTL